MGEVAPLDVLASVVEVLGGETRAGQELLVSAVSEAITNRTHLLVQAGTGTGKSLGYLVPAAVWAKKNHTPVLIATATLALQTQLAKSDLPNLLRGMDEAPSYAILKGRTNYACLQRVLSGSEVQSSLFSGEDIQELSADTSDVTKTGLQVIALREWAENELESGGLADRDDAPPHNSLAWSQVSIPVRECPGAAKCPFGDECFVEESRRRASEVDLVVTNHSLLAIDAMHGNSVLPHHGAVIIDEAHELVNRVTMAAGMELSPLVIDRTMKRILPYLADDDFAVDLVDLPDQLRQGLEVSSLGRITQRDDPALLVCDQIRAMTRRAISALGESADNLEKNQATAAMKEIFDITERLLELSSTDVIWIAESERFGRYLAVAPLSVSGLLRENVLNKNPCVFTSATLAVGGGFSGTARSLGLKLEDQLPNGADSVANRVAPTEDDLSEDEEVSGQWRGLDVGSPFDYRKQGIIYLAKHLPKPSRDGIAEENLAEIAQLVWAAGGRTLGLFSSQRAAQSAAEYVRKELNRTILCQGDSQLAELTKRFNAEPETSLFGTLSLWQGLDAPGETCRLVIIDKIPFPRPDDPLIQARQKVVEAAGGNGFMAVAVQHAGLLLAQGVGRLIRSTADRGVVAVLDPRLLTQRYGSYLRASLPDLWPTTDPEVAVSALLRLRNAESGS